MTAASKQGSRLVPAQASRAGVASGGRDIPKTVDLHALARLQKGGRVKVEPIPDRTLDAFDHTLHIIRAEGGITAPRTLDEEALARKLEYAPQNSELRKIFIFAEILGGYDTVHDLTSTDTPHHRISRQYGETVLQRELSADELRRLEEFHAELKRAVENAKEYYRNTHLQGLGVEEMTELYHLVLQAKAKAKELTEIIGRNLIFQIEKAVERLHEIRQKALSVERTVNGIFLVDNEVMYIPGNELIDAVNTIFKGVGNPYLAGNIDGVLLLAARNLLIEVVSFYSYYGKHQIYQLFKHGHTVDRQRMTMRIRNEIRKILQACKEDNKLVLTRVMQKEAEQLDLSIEAIQREAEKEAVNAVIMIMPPPEPVAAPKKKKSWFGRLFDWFGN